jgi:hypothetical protein
MTERVFREVGASAAKDCNRRIEFGSMKNLRNVKDREEIARRMGNVRADSQRLWGKMSAHQMICHLSDGFRLYMGERKAEAVGGIYPSRVLRWFALWAPMHWPKGFQTMKELDQQGGGGTSPVEFARDLRELRSLLERFTKQPRDFSWGVHPHFATMNEKEWMRLAYLHADHHLRQFGC